MVGVAGVQAFLHATPLAPLAVGIDAAMFLALGYDGVSNGLALVSAMRDCFTDSSRPRRIRPGHRGELLAING